MPLNNQNSEIVHFCNHNDNDHGKKIDTPYCLGEVLLLRVSPNLSLKKHTLLRIFVGQGWKKITFLLVQQTQRLGDLASNAMLVVQS